MEELHYYSKHPHQRYMVLAFLPLGFGVFAFSAAVIWSYYCLSGVPAGTVVRPLNLCGDVLEITGIAAVSSFICGGVVIWLNRKRFWPCVIAIIGILASLSFVLLSLFAIRFIIYARGLVDLG
jgi:hypothetical protein